MKPLDSYSDPETWLADFARQLSAMREQGERANAALHQATGAASAANGDVTVVVGRHGQVQALDLTDNALRLGPAKLSQAILAAWREAQNNAVETARDSVAELVGEERAHEFLDRYKLPEDEEPGAWRPEDREHRSSAEWVRKDDGRKRW